MTVLNAFIGKVVVQIINPLIMLLAAGALIVFMWGIFEFVKGAGDEQKREEGRSAIFWGLIGLIIIFGAYGIINLALKTFGIQHDATNDGVQNPTDFQINPGQFSPPPAP